MFIFVIVFDKFLLDHRVIHFITDFNYKISNELLLLIVASRWNHRDFLPAKNITIVFLRIILIIHVSPWSLQKCTVNSVHYYCSILSLKALFWLCLYWIFEFLSLKLATVLLILLGWLFCRTNHGTPFKMWELFVI